MGGARGVMFGLVAGALMWAVAVAFVVIVS